MIIFPTLSLAFLSLSQGRSIRTLRSAPSTPNPSNSTTEDGYNNTYPLSSPSKESTDIKYRIALISDLDNKSKKGKEWISYLQYGYLMYNPTGKKASVLWDKQPTKLASEYSRGDRGMELSELVVFDGRLLTVDDRTGIIYEMENLEMHPWVILAGGDGHTSKGLKAEWASVKDETLYVGGHGNPIKTPDGKVDNDPLWIKTISATGEVKHLNWISNYDKLLRAQQIEPPGYSLHESGVWSSVHKKWYFLPRKSSKQGYDRKTDEKMSANVLLTADPDFSNITVTQVGEIVPSRGYSSLKVIPGTNDDVMVALKVEEINEKTSTYITVFTTSGQILLPDSKVARYKYEGIEFV